MVSEVEESIELASFVVSEVEESIELASKVYSQLVSNLSRDGSSFHDLYREAADHARREKLPFPTKDEWFYEVIKRYTERVGYQAGLEVTVEAKPLPDDSITFEEYQERIKQELDSDPAPDKNIH